MIDKANILIVDDEIGPRESLRMILKPSYNVYTAEDGEKALDIIKQYPIDLITLDLKMPGKSGIEVLKEVREHDKNISVIIITAYGTLGTITSANQYGVSDFIAKPFDKDDVHIVVEKSLGKKKQGREIRALLEEIGNVNDISIKEKAKKIFENSAPHIHEIAARRLSNYRTAQSSGNIEFFKLLKLITDIFHHKTYAYAEHAERIYHYCSLFFDGLQLTDYQKGSIEIAAYFHDIGKLCMDMRREGQVPYQQTGEWQEHPSLGVKLLEPARLPASILEIILHHHERYDGNGFPHKLRGNEIPLGARILRIANIYDAQLLAKPFPEIQTKQDIINNMNIYSAGEVDPHLLQIFFNALQTNDTRLQ